MRDLLENPTNPAPAPIRRRAGCGVLIIALALTGWAIAKHAAMGGLSDHELRQGIDAMRAAVKAHDPSGMKTAEPHFVDAASVSIFDRYPAFLIHVERELQHPDRLGSAPVDRVAKDIWAGDWPGARIAAAALGKRGTRPRVYWERLIRELAGSGLDERAVKRDGGVGDRVGRHDP